ncbi:MAG: NAD(P)/FAD-dependent oxidoreductase, partial [Methanosarcinales archaeon]|nr:NAD(P)/FAD-dependent oxidoreductase [Methanosarcinales archaeon]
IVNAMDAGKIAGEVATQAISEGDVSKARLKEYETTWRARHGKRLKRSLAVKNHFVPMSDRDLNKLVHSVDGVDLSTLSLFEMLGTLIRKNPRMLFSLRKLFI